MDDQRFDALCWTLGVERDLIERMTALNQRFHVTLGSPDDRHKMGLAALAAQDQALEALAEQGHVLHEELLTIHHAYEQLYPRRSAAPNASTSPAAETAPPPAVQTHGAEPATETARG